MWNTPLKFKTNFLKNDVKKVCFKLGSKHYIVTLYKSQWSGQMTLIPSLTIWFFFKQQQYSPVAIFTIGNIVGIWLCLQQKERMTQLAPESLTAK